MTLRGDCNEAVAGFPKDLAQLQKVVVYVRGARALESVHVFTSVDTATRQLGLSAACSSVDGANAAFGRRVPPEPPISPASGFRTEEGVELSREGWFAPSRVRRGPGCFPRVRTLATTM